MAKQSEEITVLATLCEGIGHPLRMSILYALRRKKSMRASELRAAVSELYAPVQAGDLQFHLFKMQICGIISVRKEGQASRVELLQDVSVHPRDLR